MILTLLIFSRSLTISMTSLPTLYLPLDFSTSANSPRFKIFTSPVIDHKRMTISKLKVKFKFDIFIPITEKSHTLRI